MVLQLRVRQCGWNSVTLSLSTQRLTIPESCDPHLADLIRCCWKQDAKVRMSSESVIMV